MPHDGALIVGGISLATLAGSRFTCLINNGPMTYGCVCMDKPLIDDGNMAEQLELGDNVKGYMFDLNT